MKKTILIILLLLVLTGSFLWNVEMGKGRIISNLPEIRETQYHILQTLAPQATQQAQDNAALLSEIEGLRRETIWLNNWIDKLEEDIATPSAGAAFWSLMMLADIEEVSNYSQFNNLGHDSVVDWLAVEEFLQELRDEKENK